MYNELFKLSEPPFRLTPDPQFLFHSKQHSRAKAYMESTIWLADGFVVITGEIGSGKTTLIECFLDELPDDVVLAYVNQTQLTPTEFLQAVLVEFGFKPFRERKVELLSMLKSFMVEQYSEGKTLLLIVDEAQNLSHKVLEELRLLSGIEAQKEKPLRIVLAGQPELSEALDSRRLEQLRQRVRLRFHLGPLSKRETAEYIQHRLDVAGADGRKIFDKDAIELIYRYTGGVPRLINVLCDTSLLCGFAETKDTIDVGLVREALDELQWVDYAQRMSGRVGAPPPVEFESREETSHIKDDKPVPATLDLLYKDQPVTEYKLPLGRTIIGRTGDNDLQIRSRFISRHHMQIITNDTQSAVEDLKSTNGVVVGTKRVKHHVLVDGDVIQLGEHKLVYRNLRGVGAGDTGRRPALNTTGPVDEADEDEEAAALESEVNDEPPEGAPDAADDAESDEDSRREYQGTATEVFE